MIFINEWLPNPVGADAKGEFIELFNSGTSSVSLYGWKLKATGKKIFSLGPRTIAPGGYLLLPRSVTKLGLKNSDEKLFLYDPTGRIADHSSFDGTAGEGKSFNRITYVDRGGFAEDFAWGDPTPGFANKATQAGISSISYPLNTSLDPPTVGVLQVVLIATSLGVALAVIMFYAIKQYDDLSQLFFGRDEGIW